MFSQEEIIKMNSDNGKPIALPINCIDEICVYVKVHLGHHINHKKEITETYMAMNMESPLFYDGSDDNDGCDQYRLGHFSEKIEGNVEITPEQMEEFVTKALDQAWFDVFAGKFTWESQAKITQQAKRRELLKKNKRLAIVGGECCVCYVSTSTRTDCKHSVCLPCLQKIKPTKDEDDEDDDENELVRCPMCRDGVMGIY